MTEKEEAFCREYLIDLSRTQAAIRAGFAPESAKDQGAQLMARADISARIDDLMAERSRRTDVSAERVIRELARIAFFDASRAVDLDEASVRADACRDDTAAIASVRCKTTTSDSKSASRETVEREIKFADKLKALELLGRHFGMFEKNACNDEKSAGGVIVIPEVIAAEEFEATEGEAAPDPESGDENG